MNRAKWKTIKRNFSAAHELPAAERDDFLAGLDPEVRAEVEKLLASVDEAEDFIGTPLLVEKGLRRPRFEDDAIGRRLNDYLILEKLGEGGMGIVFLAEKRGREFTRRVALKLIKRGMDTNRVLERFLRERRILASLEHPNIARLFDGGSTDDGLPYFVMEYVEGETVKKYCESRALGRDERLRLFLRVCAAVAYAHRNLVVHRDLKPSNIVVTAAGEPKLLDFGIAKLLSDDRGGAEPTATVFRMLTPEYASPEQMRGERTTTATDVYSLGVVLCELLTGMRPFEERRGEEEKRRGGEGEKGRRGEEEKRRKGENESLGAQSTSASARQRVSSSPPLLFSSSFLRGDLENIVLKAISAEPERRYNSVAELSDDIERYLNGLPVRATDATRFYRLRKFVKRHRAGVAGAVSFVLLLCLATALTSWQYAAARRERAKAEQRFRELHDVARSLLTETNAALKKLPENLEIRRSMVEKSVEIMDRLAGEETNDAVFLSELADAYDELGKLRYLKFHESRSALGIYEKALRLRDRAVESAPRDVAIAGRRTTTLGNILEVYYNFGDREKILEYWQTQHENNLRILAIDPENAATLNALSAETEAVADILKTAGRDAESADKIGESFDFIEKAIAAQQKAAEPAGRVDLVAYLMQKGSLMQKTGRADEALEIYRSAAEISEQTYRADNSLRFAFNQTSRLHRLMADIYRDRGDWRKFLEHTEFSADWIGRNLENQALDPPYLRGTLSFYVIRGGIALRRLGRPAKGAARVDEGVGMYLKAVKTSANDGENIFYAPETLEMVSAFYAETGQPGKGVRLWQEFIDLTEPFAARNPDDATSLSYLAYALERKGDFLAKYDSQEKSFAETAQPRLVKALVSYQQSSTCRKDLLRLEPFNQLLAEQDKALSAKLAALKTKLNFK
ncbi:MAG: serine/threonine protein kinase [Acidobacteria bacterium]|nr:serine/threonine protein kinase [Acidobacteriota bacterium]